MEQQVSLPLFLIKTETDIQATFTSHQDSPPKAHCVLCRVVVQPGAPALGLGLSESGELCKEQKREKTLATGQERVRLLSNTRVH